MVPERHATEIPPLSVGTRQGRSWIVAAALVVVVSLAVSFWLHQTARQVDEDALGRRASSVAGSFEERMRLIEFVTQGAQGLVGESLATGDLLGLSESVDPDLVRVLSGLARYHVDDGGVGAGTLIWGLPTVSGDAIPAFDLATGEVVQAAVSDEALLSPPRITDTGSTYAMLRPALDDAGNPVDLIGFLFSAERLLADSTAAEGRGTVSGELIDARSATAVASYGDPAGNLQERVTVQTGGGTWELVVRPGPEFGFTQSFWLPAGVVAAGIVVALLLVRMALMARARAADLAERLGMAEALNRNKDQFLASVSHELRTPLTVVVGMAEEMGTQWDTFAEDERTSLLGLMTEQAREAASIVEDLLVAARSDSGTLRLSMVATDLAPHVEYALSLIPKSEHGRVEWHAVEQRLLVDPTRLRQILRNLLDNAVRYGGPTVRVTATESGEFVRVAVEDNGQPIREDAAALIFEPYERLDNTDAGAPSGVGIGLYVSRVLAQLMGGDLVWSNEFGFNRFQLTVPVDPSDRSRDVTPMPRDVGIAARIPAATERSLADQPVSARPEGLQPPVA
jgi:signal transduction histidine kinase